MKIAVSDNIVIEKAHDGWVLCESIRRMSGQTSVRRRYFPLLQQACTHAIDAAAAQAPTATRILEAIEAAQKEISAHLGLIATILDLPRADKND